MTAVDFIWLCHPASGGTFRCPAEAAEAWQENGWEPCDEPAEQNPATAEWQPLTPPAPAKPEPEAPKTKTKAAARGETQEG